MYIRGLITRNWPRQFRLVNEASGHMPYVAKSHMLVLMLSAVPLFEAEPLSFSLQYLLCLSGRVTNMYVYTPANVAYVGILFAACLSFRHSVIPSL